MPSPMGRTIALLGKLTPTFTAHMVASGSVTG